MAGSLRLPSDASTESAHARKILAEAGFSRDCIIAGWYPLHHPPQGGALDLASSYMHFPSMVASSSSRPIRRTTVAPTNRPLRHLFGARTGPELLQDVATNVLRQEGD